MFKTIVIIILSMSVFVCKFPDEVLTKEVKTQCDARQVVEVINNAVGDTLWLTVSSESEMNRLLANYYTGPLLQEVSEKAWDFIGGNLDWNYTTTSGNYEIAYINESEAVVCLDILESDAVTGEAFISRAEYFLVKTEAGWRISGTRLNITNSGDK